MPLGRCGDPGQLPGDLRWELFDLVRDMLGDDSIDNEEEVAEEVVTDIPEHGTQELEKIYLVEPPRVDANFSCWETITTRQFCRNCGYV